MDWLDLKTLTKSAKAMMARPPPISLIEACYQFNIDPSIVIAAWRDAGLTDLLAQYAEEIKEIEKGEHEK